MPPLPKEDTEALATAIVHKCTRLHENSHLWRISTLVWGADTMPGLRDSCSRIFPNNLRSNALLVSLICFGPVRVLVPVLKLSAALVSEALGN